MLCFSTVCFHATVIIHSFIQPFCLANRLYDNKEHLSSTSRGYEDWTTSRGHSRRSLASLDRQTAHIFSHPHKTYLRETPVQLLFLSLLLPHMRLVCDFKMVTIPQRLVPRTDTSSSSREAPYIALIIPAIVFILLGLCIALRSIVKRRVAKHGERSLEFWPWSWLSACVGGTRVPRAHSWEVSVSSPTGLPREMRQAAAPPPPPAPSQQKKPGHEERSKTTRKMWETVGADHYQPKHKASNRSSNSSSRSSIVTGDSDVAPQQGPSTSTIAKPEPARIKGDASSERSSRGSLDQDDDISNARTKKYGRQLAGPPVLQLPAEFGRSGSSWEIDTKKL